jgi:REP element-mobilizing transposase RayT
MQQLRNIRTREGTERYRVKVHCYVLMVNHFHLVATTPEGNTDSAHFQTRFKDSRAAEKRAKSIDSARPRVDTSTARND